MEKKELEREIPARTNWCGERVSDGGCWWGEWKLRLPCKGVDGWMGWDIRLMDHNTLHCTAILPLGLFFFFTYLSRRLMGWGTACFLFLGEGRKILRFCFCGELSFFYLMMIWKWPFMKWRWFFLILYWIARSWRLALGFWRYGWVSGVMVWCVGYLCGRIMSSGWMGMVMRVA